ncbi:MAG TPA: hypothetical protein VHZ03_15550 [Trebonia sp.]|jgi:phage shock protein A|nr:hypothetical protein [Trebonia sp.]
MPAKHGPTTIAIDASALDFFYQSQIEELTRIRRAVADQATQRKRLELQANSIRQQVTKLERLLDQAPREDLRQEAEQRLITTKESLLQFERRHSEASKLEEEMTLHSLSSQQIIDSFRTNREQFRAEYQSLESLTKSTGLVRRSTADGLTDEAALKIGAITSLLELDLPPQIPAGLEGGRQAE